VLLLRDIKTVFGDRGADKLRTEEIIAGLVAISEAPWAAIRKGEPIDGRSLAYRLGKYGIGSKPQRDGDIVFKGYSRAQFIDAWKRYPVPDDDDPSPVGRDSSVTSVTEDTDGARVTDVTDAKGWTGEPNLFATNGHAAQADRDAANAAYTAGLCRDCGDKPHSAGRPRCDECHAIHVRITAGYEQ
jgi:Protein of unknown function (DUF3631)